MISRLHLNDEDIPLAEDRRTPSDVLAVLALHPSSQVRRATGANPSCPEHALYLLAIDPEREVRFSLAQNARISRGILKAISEDDDDQEIRDCARRTLKQVELSWN